MLFRLVALIDGVNDQVGRKAAWLALALALVQFAVVVLRYVFAIGFVWMQETVVYLYGLLFMLGAGYALLQDGHVRVDVFYRGAGPRMRAAIDLAGSVLLLLPVCGLILWVSFDYVAAAWSVTEGSSESLGLPLTFAYKTVIWVFAALVGAQGLSLALKAVAYLSGSAETYPFRSDDHDRGSPAAGPDAS